MFRNMRCNCKLSTRLKRLSKRRPKNNEECKIMMEKRENKDECRTDEEEKSLITVKCFEINQKQVEVRRVRNSGYDQAVTDLENLEKLILRDSVKETTSRRRGMETIREEVDLAFSNLSYDKVHFSHGFPPQLKYENVEMEREGQHLYENVDQQYYENIPVQQNVRNSRHLEPNEEYETYDFGENGIYQNIVFTKAKQSTNSDVNVKVDALQKCINEVNDIIKMKSPEKPTELQQIIQKPLIGDHNLTGNDAAAPKPRVQNKNRNISSSFRSWALGSTEHPKIDINKLTKTKPSDEIFTQEEKNVVTDFLKSIKNELKM